MKQTYLLSLLLLIVNLGLIGQDFKSQKTIEAKRITSSIHIDGILDEKEWIEAPKGSDFLMVIPGDGDLERKGEETEFSIIYDDNAIYFAAWINFSDPSKILHQLGARDDIEKITDFFIISINPYNDGQQVFNFIVTAAGVQVDGKYSGGEDDLNWNAVWDSEISFDDKGWKLEVRIPYSELRFPKSQVQQWAINFARTNKHLNEEYTWNYIDKSVGDYILHYGLLEGLENIEPPTRLSFLPYLAGYYSNVSGVNEFNYSAGMDVKYGINDAFTLDMTLIPDFGQTAFDELVLNLGPFEVQYDENRPFFTEGTELFSKGNLFYSRRIGNTPTDYYSVYSKVDTAKEELISNPSKTALLNATKVSGRTKSGLGIGVFNAITNETKATVKSKLDDSQREIVTEPYANYNLIVLDQRFNQNSFVSFVNSNVIRQGDFRDANVSAFLFDVSNKSNSYKVFGQAKYSNVMLKDSSKTGYEGRLGFAKIKGNWRFQHESKAISKNFDNTDLGFMTTSNILENETEISYQIFEPTKYFNTFRTELQINHDRRLVEDHFMRLNFRLSTMITDLDFLSYGANLFYTPLESYDFFEPRKAGSYLIRPVDYGGGAWISTDYRKTFAVDIWAGMFFTPEWNSKSYEISIVPMLRLSNRFFVKASAYNLKTTNDLGWVNQLSTGETIMGFRSNNNIISGIEASYIFTSTMSANISFRHYWADIEYYSFKKLNNDGYLSDVVYNQNHNTTFNSWNMDLGYSWWFAPGSQMTFLYRNSLVHSQNVSLNNYFDNLKNIFDMPFDNSISLRLTYFLDYNRI